MDLDTDVPIIKTKPRAREEDGGEILQPDINEKCLVKPKDTERIAGRLAFIYFIAIGHLKRVAMFGDIAGVPGLIR